MITEKLITLLNTRSDELSASWVRMIKENENTSTSLGFDQEELVSYARFVYRQLELWLDWQTTSAEVAKLFWQVGVDKKAQEVSLAELHYGLTLARRNLYINILEKLGEDDLVDMKELIAFTSRITYFFDKISFFAIKGYEGLEGPSTQDESALDGILNAFRSGASAD